MRCHYCKRLGHLQRYCNDHIKAEAKPSRGNKESDSVTTQKVRKVAGQREDSSDSEGEIGPMVCHMQSAGGSKHSGSWIIDSGAICQICNDVGNFVNFKHLEKPMEAILGNGMSLKADRYGMAEFSIPSPDGKNQTLKFEDVLCVSLSYSTICYIGIPKPVVVSFESSRCHIFGKRKEKLLLELSWKGCIISKEFTTVSMLFNKQSTDDLWH